MRHKRPRLTRSADFDRVYRRGRSAASRSFVVYAFSTGSDEAAPDPAHARLGVSVGRRVGGAVERNTVKRMLREAFWALEPGLPADHDFVVVARAGAGDVVSREGRDGVRRELEGLLERLGWTVSAPEAPS